MISYQSLGVDGQTIDKDIHRRADTVTTSSQTQNPCILGRPFHSFGTALPAARRIQKGSNSAKHVLTFCDALDQSVSTSPSSEDEFVHAARVRRRVDLTVPEICQRVW